ncbi:hypothetical protein BH11PLA2_BH11PLA2_02840 [soil metagenome]
MAGKPLPPSTTTIKLQKSITLRTLCDALACLEKNEIPANHMVVGGRPQGVFLQKYPIIFDRKPLEAKPGFKELRTFVLREWDQKLTANTAERLIGELVRRGHFSDIQEAEVVLLEEAAELLSEFQCGVEVDYHAAKSESQVIEKSKQIKRGPKQNAAVEKSIKLYEDCKASGLTKRQFLRERGLKDSDMYTLEAGRKALERRTKSGRI